MKGIRYIFMWDKLCCEWDLMGDNRECEDRERCINMYNRACGKRPHAISCWGSEFETAPSRVAGE